MKHRSKPVLETITVREVIGIFRSRDRLREAIDAMLLAGFDRANLDLVGGIARLRKAFSNPSISPDALRNVKGLPGKAPLGREDIALVQAMVVGIFGFLAAAGAAALVIATQRDAIQGVIAAILAGSVVAALSGYLFARRIKPKDVAVVDEVRANHGVMLWVRVDLPEQEARAREILLAHDASDVRSIEVEIAKTPDDLPFNRLRPDPFIPVRLGDL